MKCIYVCEVERFGYTLRVAAATEEEARTAITEEYINAYKNYNGGADPREDIYIWDEYTEKTYYDKFVEDLYVSEIELGVVEWT